MKKWDSKNIRRLRKKYRLSQRELGELLGVTQNYVHLMEKEVRNAGKPLKLLLDCVEEKLKRKGR